MKRKGIGFEQEADRSRENILLRSVDGRMSGLIVPAAVKSELICRCCSKQL